MSTTPLISKKTGSSFYCFESEAKESHEENHLNATRERHAIPLNSEEGTIFLNVILPMAYSKLYRESGPNKMALLASILLER